MSEVLNVAYRILNYKQAYMHIVDGAAGRDITDEERKELDTLRHAAERERDRLRALGAHDYARAAGAEASSPAAWAKYIETVIKPAEHDKTPAPPPPDLPPTNGEPIRYPFPPSMRPDPGDHEYYEPYDPGRIGDFMSDLFAPITSAMSDIWQNITGLVIDFTGVGRQIIRTGGGVILRWLPLFLGAWLVLALVGITAGFRLGPFKVGVRG